MAAFPGQEGEGQDVNLQCPGRAGSVLDSTAEPAVFSPAIFVSQISTQRKVNIYNILQEIIQQEGELEEQCVQRLVTIASKEMRELSEVAGSGPHHALPLPVQKLGCRWAWEVQCPCPVTSQSLGRLRGPGEWSQSGVRRSYKGQADGCTTHVRCRRRAM